MRKIRTWGLTAMLAAVGVTSCLALDMNGLIAAYPMDDGSGAVAVDVSGNGHDGVITEGTWVAGVYGEAVQFSGGQSHMAAEGVLASLPNNAISIGAWFQLQAHTTYEGIISGSEAGVGAVSGECCQYRIMIDPGFSPFYNAGGHQDVTVSGANVEEGVWYHYALTIDGTVTLYLDGAVVAESNAVNDPLPELGTPLLVGTGEGPGTWPLTGLVDEVFVYDRALSAAEVNAIMGESLAASTAVDARGKLPLSWAAMKSAR
ncbi:MAG: LamG domain-containing protein [Candidatus Poribacteria bacterium]